VAVDAAHNRIDWANYAANKISAANLDGSGGGSDLNTTGATADTPEGVAIDAAHNRIYWTGGGGRVSSANLDGSGAGSDLNTTGATVNNPVFPALVEGPAGAGVPVVSGAGVVGSVLSCSQGGWLADLPEAFLAQAPSAFGYAWQLNGTDIAGASGATLTTTQPGSYSCRVSASNVAGSAAQTSVAVQVTPSNALTLLSKKVSKRGVITLRVRTQAAGKFGVSARYAVKVKRHRRTARYARTRKTAPSGIVTLKLKPTKGARKALKAHRRLRVTIALKFTPTAGGSTNVKTVKLTVRAARARHG
jgi:hypothetical protein